jgi:hypothetical protein
MCSFAERFGFSIESLRIERIEFADKNLQNHVSEFAVSFTRLAAQQSTIAAERRVELAMAERNAAKLQIESNAENERRLRNVQMEADSESISSAITARLLKLRAEAEAVAERIKGRADADVIAMKAEANVAAIRSIGGAEAEVLRLKGEQPKAALSIIVEKGCKRWRIAARRVRCCCSRRRVCWRG